MDEEIADSLPGVDTEKRFGFLTLIERTLDDSRSVKLIQMPDGKTGKRIWLPLFFESEEDENNFKEVFSVNKDNSCEVGLNSQQKERLSFCLEVLNLPPILAVHVALNRLDLSLDEFATPKDKKLSILISVFGMAQQGKSALLTYISLKEQDIPIFDFEEISEGSFLEYQRLAKKKGLGANSSFSELLGVIKDS